MKKRIGSVILTLAMMLALFPAAAVPVRAEGHDHTDWTEWTDANKLPDSSGSYYLTDNVTLSTTWSVPNGETNLCLNGKQIALAESATTGSVISISSGRVLNLYDEGTGTHTITSPAAGESVTITGGLITGGKGNASNLGSNTYYGGGVYINANGTLHMYGGTIAGNTANRGGGVYVLGSFTMDGGTVSHNLKTGNGNGDGGGVMVANGGSFTMNSGAVVEYNHSERNGGGIGSTTSSTSSNVSAITVNSGAIIRGNKSDSCGGGISLSGAKLNLTGGTISGNTATGGNGGGVYLLDTKSEFTMTNGTIANNTASRGGGVYLADATFTMNDGTISGNSATEYGGGVCLYSNTANFSMSGGVITGNSASGSGAGVYFGNGKMTVSGSAQVKDNTNGAAKGNVYLPNTALRLIIGNNGLTTGAELWVKTQNVPGASMTANPLPIAYTTAPSLTLSQFVKYFHSDENRYGVWKIETTADNKDIGLAYYCTLTFNANGGTGTMAPKDFYNSSSGTSVTLPDNAFERAGYTFAGWKSGAGESYANGGTATLLGNTTLYAQWTAERATPPTITVPTEPITTTYGSSQNITVNAEHAEGHTITKYEWYSTTTNSNTSGTQISGATNSTYTTDTLLGVGNYYYYCKVTSKRADNGQTATATSSAITVTVNKASQAAPTNAPTAASTTVNSVTLTATDGYEYRRGADGTWQTSNIFTGLDMNTEYTFYQRVAGDDNHEPSDPSDGATISTANHVHSWSYSANGAVLTATCADTDDSHGATKTATLTISATGKTYDGTAVTASVTGSIDGVTTPSIVYKQGNTELTEAPKDAGTYTANITLGVATASVEFTINKAALTVTANDVSVVYGSNSFLLLGATYSGFVNGETSSVLGGTLSYLYNYAQYGNVGNYTITPSGLTSNNYEITFQTGTLTVNPKDITISGIKAADKVYDGTTAATLSYNNVTFGGVVNGDKLTVTATGTFADKNVGTGKTVTISNLSLGGEKAGNYQLAGSGQQASTAANITAKAVTVSGITAESKVYDGDTTATLKYDGVTFSGKIDGDTLTVAATGTFDSAAKGTDKTVTISGLTLGGADVGNYILAAEGQQTTTKANITGAATSVTTVPTASPIVYGQTLGDSTLTGGVGSVDGSFSWAVPNTAPSVSDSGVTEYDVTFTPTDEENYAPSTCKVRLTVSKATPTYTAPAPSAVFGQTLSEVTLPSGWAWDNGATSVGNVGSHTFSATYTPEDTDNYNNVTVDLTVTVSRKTLSGITVNRDSYAYGATPSAPTLSGSVPGSATMAYLWNRTAFLVSALSGDGTDWNDTKPTEVGTYYIRAVIAGTDDYAEFVTPQVMFKVTKSETVRSAPAAPTVSGTTVTVADADKDKALEYSLDGSTWLTASPNDAGAFTVAWSEPVENATLQLRYAEDGSYAQPSDPVNGGGTITTTTYTVRFDAKGGSAVAAQTVAGGGTVSRPSDPVKTGYTFKGWYSDAGLTAAYAFNATVNSALTLYAKWEANTYAVRFNANGGTGTISDQAFTYGAAQALTARPDTFAKTGYVFTGWATTPGGAVAYKDGQSVQNLTTDANGSVTLYAVWAENVYKLTGSVKSDSGTGITLKLMRGGVEIASGNATMSGSTPSYTGTYSLANVPAGTYNLVAEQDGVTMTVAVVVTGATEVGEITMPGGNTSSKLVVEGADTPAVVVSGLEKEAADKAVSDRSITITMTVEKQEAQQLSETATEAEQETQSAINAIKSEATGSDGVEYMNITVQKEVKNSGGTTESTETLTTTNTVMEIVIPYDMDGKKNITVYRHHDGAAAPLTQTGTKADGTYQVDTTNGLIYLYTKQFSTYAIAYQEAGSEPVTPPPAPLLPVYTGGETSYCTITVAKTEGGTVTVDRKTAPRGAAVTLTATADSDFQLSFLAVTDAAGEGIPLTQAGDKYTFTMPSSNVTVTAAFAPKPCAQNDTCPISAFTDADPAAWYHDGVHWAIENDVMSGYGNGLFGPNDAASRATMAQILWNMEGKPAVNYAMSYTDVASREWYVEAVRWASAEGIMNGYGDGLFGPDDAMTREQLVTIMYRYAQYKGVDVSVGEDTNILSYDDAFDVSEWAIPAMQWAVGSGAVGGRTDITLSPKDTATRAEIATIVMRYRTKIAN